MCLLFVLCLFLMLVPNVPLVAHLTQVSLVTLAQKARLLVQPFVGVILGVVTHLRLPSVRTLARPMFGVGTKRRALIVVMVIPPAVALHGRCGC